MALRQYIRAAATKKRKAARTRIYRELYGQQDVHRGPNGLQGIYRSNQPWNDLARTMPQNWSSEGAIHMIRLCWHQAAFDTRQATELLDRLNQLRQKHKQGGPVSLQDITGGLHV